MLAPVIMDNKLKVSKLPNESDDYDINIINKIVELSGCKLKKDNYKKLKKLRKNETVLLNLGWMSMMK